MTGLWTNPLVNSSKRLGVMFHFHGEEAAGDTFQPEN